MGVTRAWTLGLGLQVWGWGLLQEPPCALLGAIGCLQRHLRGWDVASNTASHLEMQPSWEPPKAEVSWLAPAPSRPTTPEDAACQDASGCPGEGCRAPCTTSCWELCCPAGKGSSHHSGRELSANGCGGDLSPLRARSAAIARAPGLSHSEPAGGEVEEGGKRRQNT